jgi:ATP-dependent exoDNAse (exonuclease V) alpha subunit
MFTPSSNDVRRFFCEVFRKDRAHEILTPIEAMALDWVRQHPEYEEALSDAEAALARDYSVEGGQANPFLHLAMHLSISEQVSIDSPRGIRAAHDALTKKLGSPHEAQHEIMECLGEMIWKSQRSGLPPDGDAYIEAVKRRI